VEVYILSVFFVIIYIMWLVYLIINCSSVACNTWSCVSGHSFESILPDRSASTYPRPVTRTKRFTSTIQYCLLHFQ